MTRILLLALALGSLPVLVLNPVQAATEKWLGVLAQIPPELAEKRGRALYLLQLMFDLVFFVITPSVVYFWIYPVLPFSGLKAGIAVGVVVYLLGSLPYALSLSLRMKAPTLLIVSTLLFNLLKLAGSLGVIAHFLRY